MPDLVEMALNLTVEIQQIPAPTFHEAERADFVLSQFKKLNLANIHKDQVGNVYGRIPGGTDRPIVVSAHLDTVHPIETNLTCQIENHRITGPGIGDNALGLAGIIGLAYHFLQSKTPLPGDLWLVANVCEEGLGNLRGARAMVDAFGSLPIAYIPLEGMGLGRIYNRGLGVSRFGIKVSTPGGHSWANFGTPSAIHEIAHLATRLSDLQLPQSPRTTLNVGTISGGTSINTIAASAEISVDLRSESVEALETLEADVFKICREFKHGEVEVSIERIGQRPAGGIANDHPLVLLAKECLESCGITSKLGIASTDANIPLSLGYPSVCLGLTHGAYAHTINEYILTEPLKLGFDYLIRFLPMIWII